MYRSYVSFQKNAVRFMITVVNEHILVWRISLMAFNTSAGNTTCLSVLLTAGVRDHNVLAFIVQSFGFTLRYIINFLHNIMMAFTL